MSTIKIGTLGKELNCPICGNKDFKHKEAEIKYRITRDGWNGIYHDGHKEEQLEMFTCYECGWTALFENNYNYETDKYNIEIDR